MLPSEKSDTYFKLIRGKKFYLETKTTSDVQLWLFGHEIIAGEIVAEAVRRSQDRTDRISFIRDHLLIALVADMVSIPEISDSRFREYLIKDRKRYMRELQEPIEIWIKAETLLNKKTPFGFSI